MTDRILVAYATRTGSTAEVADAIAGRLCEAGLSAEARAVTEVTSLEGYSGAVLGSAMRYVSWLLVPLPAAIVAGPQSDRAGIRKAEGLPAKDRRTKLHRPLQGAR